MKQYTRVLARVNLDAVEYNIEMMKKNIHKNTQMMAVIKMDGYGHGAVQIAKLLEPMDYIWGYAVATLDEAILIKDACLKKPVLVLGCIFPDQWDVMIRNEIRMTVYSYEMAKEVSELAEAMGCTSMSILSLIQEWQDLVSRLRRKMQMRSPESASCRIW